ncbi:MAG: SRPBCC family protein [Leptolyngbyaceae cyanobacterium]
MTFLKKSIGVLVGLIVFIVGAGFILPSQVHVERGITIDASTEQVYDLVSNFQNWEGWSPWANLDPDAEMTITGSGLGQTMTWASEDPQVGQGSQAIVDLEPPYRIKTHLDFGAQGMADAAFDLTPTDEGTHVVWSLDTDMREGVPFLQQPISTYFGFLMDGMVGTDYETGLQNLKALAESGNV